MVNSKGIVARSIVFVVVGLLVGAAIGYLIYPSVNPAEAVTKTVTAGAVTTTVTGPGATVTVPGLTGEIKFGALLTLSGDLRTFGENHKAALELARDEINAWLKSFRPDLTVTVEFEDTQTKPDIALAKVQSFVAKESNL